MKRALLVASLFLCAPFFSLFGQQVIFNDDFALDPSLNGWAENVVTTNTATGDISPTGTAAELAKVGGTGRVTNSITRTVNTTGLRDIEVELIAFQSNTQFEGGPITQNNTDSLSIYVDIGAGFTPVMQRTGVWGAGGPGFSDGGTGNGTLVPTSTGFLLLDPGAANNSSLQIRIESIAFAAAEDFFLDDFTIQGTPIPPTVVAANVVSSGDTEDPLILLTDIGAVNSVFFSGIPFVSALKDVHLSAVQSAGRDINERLYRLRAGLGAGEFGRFSDSTTAQITSQTGVSHIMGGISTLPKEIAVPETNRKDWQWFAAGDFGRTDQNPISKSAAFEGNTFSSSVGFEYAGATNWAAGFAFTYLESDNEFAGNLGSADLTGNTAHTYATWLPSDSSYLSLRYGYTDFDTNLNRRTGLGTSALGNPDSSAHTIDLDSGYHFRFGEKRGQLVTGPTFGMDYTNGEIEDFSETGPTRGALNVASQDYESLLTKLGWQVSKRMDVGNAQVTPQIRVSWEHEHATSGDRIDLGLQQSPFLLARGNRILGRGRDFGATAFQGNDGRDYLSAGSGVRVVFDDQLSLSLDYEGHFFRDDRTSHFCGVRVSVGF